MKRQIILSVFAAILFSVNNASAQEPNAFWEFQHPQPQGNTLRCAKIMDSLYYVAGGDQGVIVRTTTDGDKWLVIANASGFKGNILSIDFGTPSVGVFVGQSGWIARTADSGKTWTRVNAGVSQQLNCVKFVNPRVAIACGNVGTMLRSTDSGKTFQRIISENTKHLRGIWFFNDSTGYICGVDGTRLMTRDTGSTWIQIEDNIIHNLNSISFFDGSSGVMAGELGAIWLTADSGKKWNRQSISPQGTCNSTWMISPSSAIVTCDFRGLYYTNNSGATWTNLMTKFGTEKLYSVSFTGKEGIVVGSNGIIIRTHNHGADWEIIFDRVVQFAAALWSVYAHDSLNATTVGTGGIVIQTTNGGEKWSAVSTPTTNSLYDLYFINRQIGTAVGENGTIIRTTNGGTTWTVQNSGTTANLRGVAFYNETNGIACGDRGAILLTTTGGNTWFQVNTNNPDLFFQDVAYLDQKTAVIGGIVLMGAAINDAIVWRTEDGGFSWNTIQPPKMNPNIPTSPTIWDDHEIYSLSFINDKVGFAAGSIGEGSAKVGFVDYTIDGGKTWHARKTANGNDSAEIFIGHNVFSASFSSPRHATVVGEGGRTSHTTDGGLSWKEIPSGTGNNLYAVHHPTLSTAFAVGLKTAILKLTTTDTYSSVKGAASAPVLGILGSIYPNPSQSVSTVSLKILEPVAVRMTLWDISGRKVRDLFNGYLPTGDHTLDIDVSTLRNGSYLLRLETVNGSEQTMIKVIR
jgi:photosystem II stability/assembly factor-like uncharacterized protein